MKSGLNFGQIIITPFDKGWKFILANLGLTFLIIIFFFNQAFMSPEIFIRSYIWGLSICITQWSGIVYISHLVDKKIPILQFPTKRIIWGLVAMVSYSVFAFVSIQILMLWSMFGIFSFDRIYATFLDSYVAFLIGGAISLSFSAHGYLHAWRNSVLNAEKLKAEMLSYKYESLRNQINPHFLFNSFNVLSDLIYDDQKQAVNFVQQMSGLFRYVLDSRDKELVPLSQELDFVNSFNFLLKTRFEDKIKIENNLVAEADDLIVPMSIQLLVENAVKHNEASARNPLKIELNKNGNSIEVRNNLQLKNVGESFSGVGLKNTQQQYKFFTDEAIEIHQSDSSYAVSLPILKADKA